MLLIFVILFLNPICYCTANSKWSCQSAALSCDGVLIFMYLLVMSKSSQMSVLHTAEAQFHL